MKLFAFYFAALILTFSSSQAADLSEPRALEIGAKEGIKKKAHFSENKHIFACVSKRIVPSTVTFRAWNASTAQPIAQWNLRTLEEFALSPDSHTVAVITGERLRYGIGIPYAVELRDIYLGQVKRTLIKAGAVNAAIYSLAWSDSGRLLATGSGDGLARVWDVKSGKRVVTLQAEGFAEALQFSSDEKLLATVGDNYNGSSKVKIWDWKQKKLLAATPFKTSSHYATLKFSPDAKQLLVSDITDGSTIFYKTKDFQEIRQFSVFPDMKLNFLIPVPKVVFSQDGRLMAYFKEYEVIVEDVKSQEIRARFKIEKDIGSDVLALQFSQNRRLQWVSVQLQLVEDEGSQTEILVDPHIWTAQLK